MHLYHKHDFNSLGYATMILVNFIYHPKTELFNFSYSLTGQISFFLSPHRQKSYPNIILTQLKGWGNEAMENNKFNKNKLDYGSWKKVRKKKLFYLFGFTPKGIKNKKWRHFSYNKAILHHFKSSRLHFTITLNPLPHELVPVDHNENVRFCSNFGWLRPWQRVYIKSSVYIKKITSSII